MQMLQTVGLEAPRGQLVMSLALALALGAKSLALALASENMYLVLIIFADRMGDKMILSS